MDPKTVGAIVTVVVAIISAITAWRERKAKMRLEAEKLEMEKEKLRLEASSKAVGGVDFNQLLLSSQQRINETYATSLQEAQEQVRALVQDIATLHSEASAERQTANQEIARIESVLREAQRAHTNAEYSFDRMSILTKKLHQTLAKHKETHETVITSADLLRNCLQRIRAAVDAGNRREIQYAVAEAIPILDNATEALEEVYRDSLDVLAEAEEDYKSLRQDSEVI